MTFNLKLTDERGAQLQMIADAEDKRVVDVIDDAIRAKVAAGVIPADLPNIEVTKTPEGIAITAPGFSGKATESEGPVLADALRLAGTKFTPADVQRKKLLIEGLGALSGIKVERMGAGIRLVSRITGEKYTLSFGVAEDLASQIERAAE